MCSFGKTSRQEKILLDEYPGDAAWKAFSDCFRPGGHLIKLLEADVSVSHVVVSGFGSDAEDWLQRPLAALGGKSPAQVLKSNKSGMIVIRSLLMRMPR